jgi:peptidoglycan hydrolase CwlO-like protein
MRTIPRNAAVHIIRVLMSEEITMKEQSLLNDICLLTGQESDIREQIRELATQALALQQEIKGHEQELEALNKPINFQ